MISDLNKDIFLSNAYDRNSNTCPILTIINPDSMNILTTHNLMLQLGYHISVK